MSVESQPLERTKLEQKDRAELAAIVEAMGGKAGSRAKKADLVDQILQLAGVEGTNGKTDAPAPKGDAKSGAAGKGPDTGFTAGADRNRAGRRGATDEDRPPIGARHATTRQRRTPRTRTRGDRARVRTAAAIAASATTARRAATQHRKQGGGAFNRVVTTASRNASPSPRP